MSVMSKYLGESDLNSENYDLIPDEHSDADRTQCMFHVVILVNTRVKVLVVCKEEVLEVYLWEEILQVDLEPF